MATALSLQLPASCYLVITVACRLAAPSAEYRSNQASSSNNVDVIIHEVTHIGLQSTATCQHRI